MIRPAFSPGPSTTGAAIRQARRAKGWSQDFLARRIADERQAAGESVDQQSIKTQLSRWENGHVEPDRFTRQLLAAVFSTPVEALFGIQPAADLPRPVLVSAHVTAAYGRAAPGSSSGPCPDRGHLRAGGGERPGQP